MTAKLVVGATQADADLCNALDPPTPGCNAGSGIHIVIPPDFAARISAGQDVPGCTYVRLVTTLDDKGAPVAAVFVSDTVQTSAADVNETKKLTPEQQAQANALAAKLAAVTVDPGAAATVADAQVSVKGK